MERKGCAEPDRMADDIGWEAVTPKGGLAHRASSISISFSSQPSLCDNACATTNRANIIGYLAVTQVTLLLVLMVSDLLSWPPVFRAAMPTPPYLLAAWLGSWLFRPSSEKLYRRIALTFLFLVAAYGMLR